MGEPENTNHPGQYVRSNIIPKGMSVTKSAKTMGVGRPALSNFLNGNAALSSQMAARIQRAFGADADKLLAMQTACDAARRGIEHGVSATARSFVPPFLTVKANEIEEWASTREARDLLAVLLRMLVNSTCGGLSLVDFPGRDDAQRAGWDGRVETNEGNPWVPMGLSGWESGTNGRISAKATEDYAKRTKSTPESLRQRMAFVFVTPRRWHTKDDWIRDRQVEGQWRVVRAWDASDLEQWLEQSIPVQAWFGACRGLNMSGVKSLDRCWVEWCADCRPSFTEDIFAESMAAFQDKVLSHLRDGPGELLRIVADSRQEGLAFLSSALPQEGEAGFRDRVVVFSQPGPLSELAVGSPGFIPVVTAPAIERELAQSGHALTGFVVEPRTAARHESSVTLDPLSDRAFARALSSMGVDDENVARLDRASGKSLTVLRRRLASSKAIRSPDWSSNEEQARKLVPMMLAGAWVADKDADRFLMAELAGYDDYENLEEDFTLLRNLEDSPVWSVGGFHGVVSKIDAMFGVHQWMTADVIKRFVDVAEIILSERDPAQDLDEDRQWAATFYGKAREISSPLRKGVAESLVLLSIHGDRLFGDRFDRDPALKVADLVWGLLEPLSEEKLLSQASNLPLYAEAAPGTFLKVFERDLERSSPVVTALMQPTRDALFQRFDRVELLWALELLAWHPRWLARVVALLAQLVELEPDDNLSNRPSESLQSIFRFWMPQTAAPVEIRIAVLNTLVEAHPEIAWRIAVSQLEPGTKHGGYSHKPRWRDYALGFGEPGTTDERHAFVIHCVKTCLGWRSHDRETLADLMRCVEGFDSRFLARLAEAVAKWADGAKDKDRAWLREQIRVSARRTMRRRSRGKPPVEGADQSALMAREAFETLAPADPVWKHWWLFQNAWIEESWDDLDGDIDVEARDKRTRALRVEAVREVAAAAGHSGILQLAFSGNGTNVAGWSVAEAVQDETARLAFLREVLKDGNLLTSGPHQFLASGFLHGVGETLAINLIESLWPELAFDTGIKLLCLCGFDRLVWSKADEMGEMVANSYWLTVRPQWRRHAPEDINFATRRLLEVGRPRAALDYAHLDWGRVESERIHGVLADLPSSEEQSYESARLDTYAIQQAFKVLNERHALTQAELARLEFLYLEIFWLEEGGAPNLEMEIEANPDLFCQAIALAFRHEDDSERTELTERESNAATKAYRLLDTISRVPGHDTDGMLDSDKLTDWVRRAQALCDSNGRKRIGDQQIGQLLSNAPVGDDGVWPCVPVRETLEAVLNHDIGVGFEVGRRNSRGVHVRAEGGAQERELAGQYEEWARACDYTYPKVATTLRQIASAYESEARWHDQESAVQRRLGY